MSHRDFAGARWIKSSYSNADTDCVELAQLGDNIGVRDSKKGDVGPILEFTPAGLAALVTEARAGSLDHLT